MGIYGPVNDVIVASESFRPFGYIAQRGDTAERWLVVDNIWCRRSESEVIAGCVGEGE